MRAALLDVGKLQMAHLQERESRKSSHQSPRSKNCVRCGSIKESCTHGGVDMVVISQRSIEWLESHHNDTFSSPKPVIVAESDGNL